MPWLISKILTLTLRVRTFASYKRPSVTTQTHTFWWSTQHTFRSRKQFFRTPANILISPLFFFKYQACWARHNSCIPETTVILGCSDWVKCSPSQWHRSSSTQRHHCCQNQWVQPPCSSFSYLIAPWPDTMLGISKQACSISYKNSWVW